MADEDKKSTYAAEDMVAAWLDAVSPETGEVHVTLTRDGATREVTYAPEAEPKFTGHEDVQEFVAKVMARLQRQAREFGPQFRGREQKPVKVLAYKGFTKASYKDGWITIPRRETGGAWALRALVVLHELAHHLNTGVDGTIIDAHGEGFRDTFVRLLESLGWTEIAAMLREAFRQLGLDREHVEEGMLSRVGKLLRHAEGASAEAERDAFLAKAQELATLHSIELAVARAQQEQGEARQTPTFEAVRLGHRGQQSNVRFVELLLGIADANDLRCTISGDNTSVTLYGFAEDIGAAKSLYMSLVLQMVADADAYIRSGAHRPIHGRTARTAFYQGWTAQITDRLLTAKWAARERAGIRSVPGDGGGIPVSDSRALALQAKAVEVRDYYDYMLRQKGVRRTWRGASDIYDGHSDARGRAAAERARLGDARAIDGPRRRIA